MVDARMDEVSWSLFLQIVRLQISLREGDAIVTYVPWSDTGPLLRLEAELHHVLGLGHGGTEMSAAGDPWRRHA